MGAVKEYFSDLFGGIASLLRGMSVTRKEFFKPKITQQYPENRDTLEISPLWRGKLTMPHDENNEHACTACTICMQNCPNGTIEVIGKQIVTEDGKKRKVLDRYIYNFGTCTFCNLCVITCPSDAIKFDNSFENALFTKSKLIEQLNNEGSKLREKKVAPKPAPVAEKPLTEEKTVADVSAVNPAEASDSSASAPHSEEESKK